MKNYRKWILCGVAWLLLYLYFDARLFTFFIHTMWRLGSMSAEERRFWQPEIHVLAAFGFAALVSYVARSGVLRFGDPKGSEKVHAA
jgi:hypothetical protein